MRGTAHAASISRHGLTSIPLGGDKLGAHVGESSVVWPIGLAAVHPAAEETLCAVGCDCGWVQTPPARKEHSGN